jgi:hypothetical protein
MIFIAFIDPQSFDPLDELSMNLALMPHGPLMGP